MFFSPLYLLALLLILTLHEAAHAWVAMRLGDPTAQRAGRLSLNPLHHLDPLGVLMLFFAGFGWGKPVPVDSRNFLHPVRDEALVALAGPAANLMVAFLAAIPYVYMPVGFWAEFSGIVLDLSLVLFVFNLVPVPPLDGSRLIPLLIPVRFRAAYEHWMQRSLPWFVALMVVDLFLLPKWFGFSVVWSGVSQVVFWLKAAILVMI